MEPEKKTPYNSNEIESYIYHFWENHHCFESAPSPTNKVFSMVMPPPNITGVLHLGHAMDLTFPDIIARYKRMDGYDVCWFPGTDQAGIATYNVVERELEKQGIKREDIGREEFIKRVWQWKNQYGNRIIEQMKLLGTSADWSKTRFTKDEAYEKAIQTAFIQYYQEGLIYKGKRIVHYCPRCDTALSDIEVDNIPEKGHLYYIKYPIDQSNEYLVVATTRPETMLGDTAVVVHPDDERYVHVHGKNIRLPLTQRIIPIVLDLAVDREFGTGVVKVTPAHDPVDYEISLRHHLPSIEVIEKGKQMNENAGDFKGLSVFEARKKVIEALDNQGLIEKIEPYDHTVGHCSRCNKTVEPILSDQWYLKTSPLASKALSYVLNGEIEFIPDRWIKVYKNWMENIQDWCISRQIWWGVQIPVWYCSCGDMVVSIQKPSKCANCGSSEFIQDPDVLDTWFGSALWPFAVMGWPDRKDLMERYFPSSLLVTAFDIIFFWVSRMIFSSLHFTGKVPFEKVYYHGLIRDKQGRKMSKSLNNVVDPTIMIDKYGADALRFTLTQQSSSSGQDIHFDEVKMVSSRNFINKIWNATKLVKELTQDQHPSDDTSHESIWDTWILHQLSETTQAVRDNLESYKFNEASQEIYSFFWDHFCDWYLEVSKLKLSKTVLIHVFLDTLKLMHPFIPFITEHIWLSLPESHGESILKTSYPKRIDSGSNHKITEQMSLLQTIIRSIRNLKSEFSLSSPEGLHIQALCVNPEEKALISQEQEAVIKLARIESFNFVEKKEDRAIQQIVSSAIQLFLSLQENIDLNKEINLKKGKLEKNRAEMTKLEQKLSNTDFISHAPKTLVEEYQEQLAEMKQQDLAIKSRIEELRSLLS